MTVKRVKTGTSVFSRIRALFAKPPHDEMIGEVLVGRRLISETELQEAMETQKMRFFQDGVAVPLGKIIVEQGRLSEQEIIDAVNDHYDLSLSSLSDNMRGLVGKIRGTLAEDVPAPRVPIWMQLTITTMFVLAVSIAILSYVILKRQQENLFEHTVKLGTVSLNYVAENAKVPLLTNDTLALNTLISNVTSVDGHYYAFIIDNNGVIRAHTDHEKIDQPAVPFSNIDKRYRHGDVTYFNYTLPGNTQVLNLSLPISFQNKKIGEVHVGLSIDFIQNLFIDERAFLSYAALVIIGIGMVVAVLFSLRFSRPVSALVHATAQIAKGNYDYKVNLRRKDEFGTLGEAFNRMAAELFRQSMMRETFGKYVGPEVMDMIVRSPGQTWLKGRRNEASILFADIRGFTGYAGSKEPEEVVEKLNEFFQVATGVILKHDGYIDKFIGDSVLAIFGVPVYLKDHRERSIRAAVDMQQKLAEAGRNGNPLLQLVGIGIASGVVVAGNIGSQAKMEYTVIGDSVNVASFMSGLAGPGEIIVGSDNDEGLQAIIDAEPLERRKIKGRERPVNVFRVKGVAGDR